MEDTQRLDDFLWALAKKITNEIHYTDLSKALMTMGEVEGAALHTHRNQAISLSAHEVLKAWKNRVAPTFEEAREKLRDIFDNIGLKSDFENVEKRFDRIVAGGAGPFISGGEQGASNYTPNVRSEMPTNEHESMDVGDDVDAGPTDVPDVPGIGQYRIRSQKEKAQGYFLVIVNSFPNSNKPLIGYLKDEVNIKETISSMNGSEPEEWRFHSNLSYHELKDVLEKVSQEDISKYDYFGCFLLSHGDELCICTDQSKTKEKEPSTMTIKEITGFFKPEEKDKNNPGSFKSDKKIYPHNSFNDIPKLFFVQACQGGESEAGYRSGFVDESASPTGKQIDLPIESHIFIFNSAPLGYTCYVNPDFGSYFIRCLCKALREQHTMSELHAIAVKVNNMVARMTARPREGGEKKQMSIFTSTLIYPFYFKDLQRIL